MIQRFAGKRVSITLALARKRRSLKQNAFYFGFVLPVIHDLSTDTGNDVNKPGVPEHLKEHVGKLVKTIMGPDGKRSYVVRSSTELTTTEWEDFIEKIRAWPRPLG